MDLPAAHWATLLPRIGARLGGRLATVRQQPPDEREAQIVLWAVPLQALLLDDGNTVVIAAGYDAPPFELLLANLTQIELTLDEADEPVALSFVAADGTRSRLTVER